MKVDVTAQYETYKIQQEILNNNNPIDAEKRAFNKRVLCVTLPTIAGIGAAFVLGIAGIVSVTPLGALGLLVLGALAGALLGFAILAIYRNYIEQSTTQEDSKPIKLYLFDDEPKSNENNPDKNNAKSNENDIDKTNLNPTNSEIN